MASFTRLEIWTDVACASGAARVAVLDPVHLEAATLTTSLAGVEGLTFTTSRTLTQAAQIVHARVVRVCWSDTTLDTEWRISEIIDQSGTGDASQLTVSAQAIALDLGRAVFVDFDALGRPSFDITGVAMTATEWLSEYVLPACVEAGLDWISLGTIDFTTEFTLDGAYVTALEIIRAIQQPGRAPGEFVLRRNGTTDYQIDLLTARGSSATTVRVQARRNLLANQRARRMTDVGTKLMPRGAEDAAVRDMSQAYWRVKTVVSGTVAELEDPAGGAGPIAFDDQLNGLYVAAIASTFSSQAITASVASTQRITVASTTGWTAGTTLLRFFRTSGASGERLISLAHPTRALSPASSGLGTITRIADVPGVVGDANLVGNPWMRTWTTGTNPPDGWTKITGSGQTHTTSRITDATYLRTGSYAYKCVVVGDSATTAYSGARSPTATPYTTSGLRHSAHAWVYVDDVTAGSVGLGVWNVATSGMLYTGAFTKDAGGWRKLELTGLDLSACTSGVQVAVITAPDYIDGLPYWGTPYTTNATFYVDSVGLGEAEAALSDVEYSGGTQLWQRANEMLLVISDVVAGYTVQLADLARLDNSDWADEPLTLGGNVEVRDTDLDVTTTQRIVEMRQELLQPLASAVQLQTPDVLLTRTLAGGYAASGGSISGTTATVSYTAAGIEALLAARGVGPGGVSPSASYLADGTDGASLSTHDVRREAMARALLFGS